MKQILSESTYTNISMANQEFLRRQEERKHISVRRGAETRMPTRFGEFRALAYTSDDGGVHMAVVKGENQAGKPTPVRVHTECLAGDAFGSHRCDCGPRLQESLNYISERGEGVVIYIRDGEGRGIIPENPTLCRPASKRDNQIADGIIHDLGIIHEQ